MQKTLKLKAPRNRTIEISSTEMGRYYSRLTQVTQSLSLEKLTNKTIHQDIHAVLPHLPVGFVDLLFLDPPYNLNKSFNSTSFKALSQDDYFVWMKTWFTPLLRTLKPTASVYICGDWRSSAAIQMLAHEYLTIQNRITWEREKGRGAKSNWKNCSEDIWFCTVGDNYYFDAEAVKLKRRVIAPYKENGKPKDWEETDEGGFRLTNPSNLWTDITVPFWSMPENTDHPTQKPEKLVAKIILASSKPGDFIFDPFLGSGTTSVVAKKLCRNYMGVEIDRDFACLAEKRLSMAELDSSIQGYVDGVFWERNSLSYQGKTGSKPETNQNLFPVNHFQD